MQLKKVNSRELLAIGYDATSLLLEVRFRISKRVYGFLNVPKKVYESLMHARSKGQYFNQYIKPNYQFIEIKQ